MVKPAKDDPQFKQALKRMTQLVRRQAGFVDEDETTDPPPTDNMLPPGWEVESLDVEDDIYVSPDDPLAIVTVVLRSVTYINPETGETVTTPVVPVP